MFKCEAILESTNSYAQLLRSVIRLDEMERDQRLLSQLRRMRTEG